MQYHNPEVLVVKTGERQRRGKRVAIYSSDKLVDHSGSGCQAHSRVDFLAGFLAQVALALCKKAKTKMLRGCEEWEGRRRC